jgi:hypothetical protein
VTVPPFLSVDRRVPPPLADESLQATMVASDRQAIPSCSNLRSFIREFLLLDCRDGAAAREMVDAVVDRHA